MTNDYVRYKNDTIREYMYREHSLFSWGSTYCIIIVLEYIESILLIINLILSALFGLIKSRLLG